MSTRESLRGSEERFRLLVEQVTDYAIFMLDAAGCIATWNLGASRIKLYRADEIIGQHFSRFYRPEDVWKCEVELETARRVGRVEDEGWRVRKDGTLFWASVVITALYGPQHEFIGYAKVTRDLSERRLAEEALRQSEERVRLLVESVKDYAIFLLDREGNVATWNIGGERLKGYRADEIIGRHFSVFYPEQDIRAGKCEIKLKTARLEGRVEDEGWRIRKDGSRFWANVVITALRDSAGNDIGFAKVTRDLTERRAAEEERLRLGRLARARIQLLATLSESLAATLTLEEVGEVIASKGTVFARADSCALYMLDAERGALSLFAQSGSAQTVHGHSQSITRESGDPTYAIGVGDAQAVWLESREQYLAYFSAPAKLSEKSLRASAFWCVPLVAESRTFGMICVGFHHARSFAEDEREFVNLFSRQCAQALARARRLDAERLAAASAERLRASLATTLRSVGDALIATDANGNITLMNRVAETLTGWHETEAYGRPLLEVFRIIHERTRAVVENPVDKVLATGAVIGLANHTVLITRDGREIPIDDSGAPIRSVGGDVEGVVLVFRDVTERNLEASRRAFLVDATAALAESLDYEHTLARVADLAVPRLADLCAVDLVSPGDEVPKRLAVAHVDPARSTVAEELAAKYPPRRDAASGVPNVLRTGRSELHSEIGDALLVAGCIDAEHLRLMRALGPVSAMVVPLVARGHVLGAMTFVFAESGRHYGQSDLRFAEELALRCTNAIGNARAYSAEQQARRAADLANKAKDEFLAVVSHELRTPLNAIMGWAGMLSTRVLDQAQSARATETIERNAIAMAQLIEDLLDMSRVISGKLRIDVQPVDVARVVDAAIASVTPAASSKDIRLLTTLAPCPPIMGDATRLQQIAWNLLSNAVKFTPKGGRVEIALSHVGTSLELSVADNGQGIAPDFLPNVFEAFRQEDAGPTRHRGGLGLGLAITKQLVELHGGVIAVSSEGPGRGASFSVTLPVSAAGPSGEISERGTRQFPTFSTFDKPEQIRGLRVLVVDDEEDARTLVATILEDCACQVTMAASVREALALFSQHVPDIVVSDIGMPGESGYDLIRQIRALPPERGGNVPAAALTAYARPEDRRKMLNAGFSIHLPKPVEAAELVAVVATLSRFIQRS